MHFRDMSRCWISLEDAKDLFGCPIRMKGGEIFIPKIPTMKMIDLAKYKLMVNLSL